MPSTEHRDWYDTPLYYDIVFDETTVAEADFLEQAVAAHGQCGGRRLLEPACGSGRMALEMARRGWKVSGFDGNPRMLAFARERLKSAGLRARLWQDWMQSFELPKGVKEGFDVAHCLVSTFKYLLSEAHARAHLECVARSLAPGGIYVLGFHLSEYEVDKRTRERWVVRDGGIEVVCNIQSWPPDQRKRLERVRSRLRVTEQGRERRTETYWDFRTYDASQVRRLLRSVPALEHLATYDFTYDLDAPRELDDDQLDLVLVLRKR